MYQALSLICFIFIFWAILGMDFAEDKKGAKSSDGDSMLPAILGGILISPLLALGGFLFVLGRIALAVPAILYGIFILCGQALQWLWKQCTILFRQFKEVLGRASRNTEKLLRKVGLRRELESVSRFLRSFFSRTADFLRGSFAVILRFFRQLFWQISDVAGRILRNAKAFFSGIGRWFVRRFEPSESRENQRAPTRSSSGSRTSWWLVPFSRKAESRDQREENRNKSSQEEEKSGGRFRRRVLPALLFAAPARRRDANEDRTDRAKMKPQEREDLHSGNDRSNDSSGAHKASRGEHSGTALFSGRHSSGSASEQQRVGASRQSSEEGTPSYGRKIAGQQEAQKRRSTDVGGEYSSVSRESSQDDSERLASDSQKHSATSHDEKISRNDRQRISREESMASRYRADVTRRETQQRRSAGDRSEDFSTVRSAERNRGDQAESRREEQERHSSDAGSGRTSSSHSVSPDGDRSTVFPPDKRPVRSSTQADHQDDRRRGSEGDRSGESSSWNWHAISQYLRSFFTRRSNDDVRQQDTLLRRKAATHRVHGDRFSQATSPASSVFHGRMDEGKATFKRIDHPEKAGKADIMEDLRKVGRHTRRRLKSIE
ncbi:MAG: hypothetical protein PHE68_00425 [Candidatus Peribacteraceae bacterium]|nr:hypothetical protein [Candidatus Peribacteraceae bacterium]MDD5074532.1 hypothetical protein [Candidatus Peribacteraceae bacterium]